MTPEKMTAMTLNVQCWDVTPERLANLIIMVRKYMPDMLGVQEATPIWIETFKSSLPEYACIGVGRENGTNDAKSGEHSAVLYRKDRFTLVDSATKWLSETPDVPGSKLAASDYVRVATWARLKRISDGKEILHINTHLNWGDVAIPQTQVILNEVAKQGDLPVLFTGDLNISAEHPCYRFILDNGFVDTVDIADEKTWEGNGKEIDFLFLRAKDIKVLKHHRCEEMINGAPISDHFPVLIEMEL